MRTQYPAASKKQIWVDKLWLEVESQLWIRKFMGTDTNSIIQVRRDLEKVAGNQINFFLGLEMDADPIIGDDWLEGRETAIAIYGDAVTIDRARQATVSKGVMDAKGSGFNFASISKEFLARWLRGWIDKSWFRVLSGDTTFTFATDATAPTSNRIVYGGDATTTADLDANDWLGTYEISRLKHLAQEADPMIPPLVIDGEERYVLFIGRNTHFKLKLSDTSYASAINYAYQGKGDAHPLISGAMVDWDGVLVYVSPHILRYSDWGSGANLGGEVNLLCGAQAGLFAVGGGDEWKEKDFDYGDKPGHALAKNLGFKKAKFTDMNEDYGVIVMKSYAPTPAATAHS